MTILLETLIQRKDSIVFPLIFKVCHNGGPTEDLEQGNCHSRSYCTPKFALHFKFCSSELGSFMSELPPCFIMETDLSVTI